LIIFSWKRKIMGTRSKNKVFNLVVRSKGAADIKRITRLLDSIDVKVKKVANTSRQANKSLGFLASGFGALTAAFSVREVARAADEIQLLKDRLRVFSKSGEEAAETFRGIQGVAKRTKTSINAIGISFNRLALATQELGLSNEEILKATEALQNTFRLSGSTIAETTAATIQFSQGLSAGALRGQELRSVIEADAVFAGKLAKEFGVARGQLIKLAETGAITSERSLKILIRDFKELSEQAAGLRTTFEQGAVLAFDAIKVKLDELNKRFDVTGKFQKGVEFFIDNFEEIISILGGFAASKIIPTIVTGIEALTLALFGLNKTPVGAIVGVITAFTALGTVRAKKDAERGVVTILRQELERLNTESVKTSRNIQRLLNNPKNRVESKEERRTRAVNEALKKDEADINKLRARALDLTERRIKLQQTLNLFTAKPTGDDDDDDKTKSSAFSLKELNKQLRLGKISIQDYNKAIEENDLKKLNDDFDNGKISADQFAESLAKMNAQLTFTEQLSLGVVNGVESYIDSVGTLAEGIGKVVSNTFKGLEDQLVEFVKNGKLSFKDLTKSILDDLLRIAIQQSITLPLAGATRGIFGAPPTIENANGNVFSAGQVVPFQNGGIVQSPTFFPMRGSKTGLMGEAGEEGILPLDRINGKLGVNASGLGSNVQVNIINNSGADIETQESQGEDGQRQLDIVIGSSFRKQLSNGTFDKDFKNNFNLNRKGF
jgi:lambda family phage tail tape measure protein